MKAKYTGQCLCGAIRYTVDVEPLFSGNCHCRDCQRASGSAFTPAMIFPASSVLISGEARFFESAADSGNSHQRGFCPQCGSQLFASFGSLPGMLGIKAGTLDDTSRYVPQLDFHVASAAAWEVMNPALPKKPGAANS
ncbi:GFA family protein [Vogesella oryzae]|uniref:GFA family protein n=1 Tax=Vogesella oryzae TaxID=1735285 RepID=UPI001582916A|nr:GFA family protein [Vogesella oryzae]